MKYFLLLLVFCLGGAGLAGGQPAAKGLIKGAQKALLPQRPAMQKEAVSKILTAGAKGQNASAKRLLLLDHKCRQAMQTALVNGVEKHIRQSIFQVIMPADGSTRGSGFVFEKDGQIWGVVSYHVSGRVGNRLKMRFYGEDGSPVLYWGEVVSSGSYGFNGADAALVLLPQQVKAHARPLVISPQGAQKNSYVDSYGFADPNFLPKDYSKNPHRRILDVCGYKLITTLPPQGRGNGACGGPLLNDKGEVVGIHSGSYQGRLGFAVNAKQAIDDLFLAMQNGGKLSKPLLFNASKIADIDISENIGVVEIKRQGEVVFRRDFKHYPGSLHYERLEQVIPAQAGDEVIMLLQRGALEARMVVFRVN